MTTGEESRGPAVIDTGVFGANLVPGSPLTALYEPIVTGREAFILFQTVAELRYGAIRRGWGEQRMRRLANRLAKAETVWAGPELAETHAQFACRRQCHPRGG